MQSKSNVLATLSLVENLQEGAMLPNFSPVAVVKTMLSKLIGTGAVNINNNQPAPENILNEENK